MIMNVINLKTLSLSVLMTSTMISGAFSMEIEPIDQDSQIKNVRSARAMFENGQSPVKQEKEIKRVNFQEVIEKADENSGCKALQTNKAMYAESETNKKNLKQELEDLKTSFPAKQKLLADLQSEIAKVEQDMESFNKSVWISRESTAGKILTTVAVPFSFIYNKYYGNEPSPILPTTADNKHFSTNFTEEKEQKTSNISINENNEKYNNHGKSIVFDAMFNDTKEKIDAQVMELKTQLDNLTIEISSAENELKTKKEEYAMVTKGAAEAQNQALLTNDHLNAVASTITTTTSNYSPLKYFWSAKEEKK